MTGPALVLGVLLTSLWILPGAASQDALAEAERAVAKRDAQQYQELLAAFLKGDVTAVESLLTMDRKRVAALASHGILAFHPWAPEPFMLAAMLHTDVALQLYDRADSEGVFVHLDLSSQILRKGTDRLTEFGGPGAAALNVFASRWYLALSRWLRDRAALLGAERFLKMGRDRLPNDPIVLYESGTLAEALATAYFPNMRVETNAMTRAGRLDNAVRWLRESLEAGGPTVMARLHLGRVLTLQKDQQEGLRHLQAVLASTPDPAIAYLAAIFSGAANERLGRLDDAAASYRIATAIFPRGHAASIALSEVLQKSGRGDESRAVLKAALELPRRLGGTSEPWWWYLAEPPGMADERVIQLREEVRR